VKIALDVDDRILTAAGGAVAAAGCAAAALVLLRSTARVQAARSALLGRPTAYRLHLRGTGIELAPWERNFVGEVVVRQPPGNGIYIGPDVPVRPERQGTTIRDSMFTGAPGAGVRVDMGADPDVTADEADPEGAEEAWDLMNRYADMGPEPEPGPFPLPALCDNGHEFADKKYGTIADRASITHLTPVGVKCPECGDHAEIAAGRYFIRDGQVVREDISDDPEASP
jgi:hypothetical protein